MSINNILQLPTPATSHFGDLEGSSTPESWANHSTTYTPADSMTPVATNPSRKRSRDESAFAADGENSYFSHPPSAQQVVTPAPIPEEEPVYGPGMVLISPGTGRPITAESQTGTWYEEKVAKEEARKKMEVEIASEQAEKQFRPQMPVSRKSIRLSQSSIRANLENILSSGAPASPPKSSTDGPERDEATFALGIGWTKLASEDPDLQAAARGWSKYIENHYRDIDGAEIVLKSRSLNAYLVQSQTGYYLFSEDLLEGKLVGKTWPVCLQNLKAVPMVFEGTEVLRAERTPGPDVSADKRETLHNGSDFDRINQAQAALNNSSAGGMDLD